MQGEGAAEAAGKVAESQGRDGDGALSQQHAIDIGPDGVGAVAHAVPVPGQAEAGIGVAAVGDGIGALGAHGGGEGHGPAIGKGKFDNHFGGITGPAGHQANAALGGVGGGIAQGGGERGAPRAGAKVGYDGADVVERLSGIGRPILSHGG